MISTGGFPAGVQFTPIPTPIVSSYLAEVNDIIELKVLLRALWLINTKKGSPRPISADELWSDKTMADGLGHKGIELELAITASLDAIVEKGIFLRARRDARTLYFLNTPEERRSAARWHPRKPMDLLSEASTTSERQYSNTAFSEYEDNIGLLTPIIVTRIEEAIEKYPQSWVIEAIKIAAERNARNWRYIEAVLSGWAAEGKPHGKPGRNSKPLHPDEFIEAYWKRQKRRGTR